MPSPDMIIAPEKSLILGIPMDASSPLATPEIQASDVKTYMEEVLKTPAEEEPSKQEGTDAMRPRAPTLTKPIQPNAMEESDQSPVSPEILASEVKIYIEEELKTPTEEKNEPSLQEVPKSETNTLTEEFEPIPTESGEPAVQAIPEVASSTKEAEQKSNEEGTPLNEEDKTAVISTSTEETEQKPSEQETPVIEEDKTAAISTEETEQKPSDQETPVFEEDKTAAISTSTEESEQKPPAQETPVIEEDRTAIISTSTEEIEQKPSEQDAPEIEEDKTAAISTSTEETELKPSELTTPALDENKTTDTTTASEETEQKPTELFKEAAEAILNEKPADLPTSTEEIESKSNDQAAPEIEEDKTVAIPTSIEETKSEEGPTNWDDLGIKFVIIPTSRYNDIVKFVYEHFYPDEPISRSTGICQPGGPGNKMMDKFYVKDALKHGVSMMATDKEDNIIAVRIGKVVRRSQGQTFKKDDALLKVTSWVKRFLPKEYSQFFLLQKLFGRMNYDVTKAFDQLNCDVLYEDSLLATSKDCRLKGLGTELVRRSFEIASGAGCEYIYTIATGEYSAKIFFKLDFTLDHEHLYEELKDKNGNQMLTDTREHTKARVFYKKIKSDSTE